MIKKEEVREQEKQRTAIMTEKFSGDEFWKYFTQTSNPQEYRCNICGKNYSLVKRKNVKRRDDIKQFSFCNLKRHWQYQHEVKLSDGM